jgi:hypothetical protein
MEHSIGYFEPDDKVYMVALEAGAPLDGSGQEEDADIREGDEL